MVSACHCDNASRSIHWEELAYHVTLQIIQIRVNVFMGHTAHAPFVSVSDTDRYAQMNTRMQPGMIILS